MPRIQRQTNLEYWQEREQRQLIANQAEEAVYNSRLNRYHTLLEAEIDRQIQAFYQRYATAEGITLADAQKRITSADIRDFEAKAKRYVELADKDRREGTDNSSTYFSKRANQEMRLYNAMMRINRLELLKAELGMTIDEAYRDMEIELDADLSKRTLDELRRQAGILGDTIHNPEELVPRIVNASFHNATWSERLWGEGDRLKSSLSILLTNGLIQGESSIELARRLRQAYDVSRFESERLLRTEMARVQTDAQMESYRRNGYERYMFIPLEGGACPECAAIGRECEAVGGFLVADEEVGYNSPPIHPNCRCSTAAQFMTRDEFNRMMEEVYGVQFTNEDEQGIIKTQGLSSIYALSRVYVNKSDKLYENMSKIRPEDGYDDYGWHGDADNLYYYDSGGREIKVTAKEFADILKRDPSYSGGDVRLLSCNGGQKPNGFAQQLANELDVVVKAPTEALWVNESGELFISDSEVLAEMWEMGLPVKESGEWAIFKPGGENEVFE